MSLLKMYINKFYKEIFLKREKESVNLKEMELRLPRLISLASDIVNWLIKQGKEKADALRLGMSST